MIQFDAFISHSSLDKATADAACAQLEAAGIRCWIAPRDIVPGSDWGASILEALDRCRVMVLIFSSNANSSPQIRREVERVVDRGIPVIPVRIEDIEPTNAMAYFMGPVHWLDAMTPPLEKHLERLAESIKMLLRWILPDRQRQGRREPKPRRGLVTYPRGRRRLMPLHRKAALASATLQRDCRRLRQRACGFRNENAAAKDRDIRSASALVWFSPPDASSTGSP